jgi:hypothetical protein
MLPYPGAVDWRANDVLWYPATFFKRFERSRGTVREFKFKWFQCDWIFQTDPDALPLLIPRTYQSAREFFEEVSEVVLKSEQVCQNQAGKSYLLINALIDWQNLSPGIFGTRNVCPS